MKVRWSKQAAADREEIYDYIRKDNIDAAVQMDASLWDAIQSLTQFPRKGRTGRVPGTWELVVKPYVIAYQIEPEAIRIVAVRHGARKWPKTMSKL